MLDNLQLWVYGTTAVIDTVLLFALIERHNWRTVTAWMLLLALGVWCWHAGTFVRLLVDQSVGPLADPIRWCSMMGMSLGLWLMPCAALHGTVRILQFRRFHVPTRNDPRLACGYLPLIMLLPIGRSLATNPSAPFLDLVTNYQIPYVIWLLFMSAVTAYGLIRTGTETDEKHLRRFYQSLAASVIVIALMAAAFVVIRTSNPQIAAAVQPIVGVSPIIPALLFAYFVMRFQLLPIILERTLVYGAILMGAVLFHQIIWRDAISQFERQYRLDIGVLEGTLALFVILLYQPLRSRVAEALQSLVDSTGERRHERQRLAAELAARARDPLSQLTDWFASTMQRSFGTNLAATWICDSKSTVISRHGMADLLDDQQVRQMLQVIGRSNAHFLTRYSTAEPDVLQFLDKVRAGALLKFQHAEVSGLFLIGCRAWGQPPSDEDLHALSLLVEQFGITLQNSHLYALQTEAEHRALQQQKLSALGLLAGSLAHEIKNPLSSIKTITQVLSEELGPGSPYAEDLRMISGEIDRLTTSTSELLESARPVRTDRPLLPLKELLAPTLRLLQHLAREHQATLTVQLSDDSLIVPIEQVSLREIVFNLISNALEAAGAGGVVRLVIRYEPPSLILEVIDNGPGFSPEQKSQLFEPFYTTKQTGTGLGLSTVARRVAELGGDIECESVPHHATTFRVRLNNVQADVD